MREALAGPKPGGPYSPGMVAEGRLVFVSGQGPLRDGTVVKGTIEEQTRLTIQNLKSVLASAGCGLADVVRCGVYLADLADFPRMNAVYAEEFPSPRPARTTVGCALMGIRVEIDCVAVVPG